MARIRFLTSELRRQERRVARIAARAETDRHALRATRQRVIGQLLRRPEVLVASFTAGFIVGWYRPKLSKERLLNPQTISTALTLILHSLESAERGRSGRNTRTRNAGTS